MLLYHAILRPQSGVERTVKGKRGLWVSKRLMLPPLLTGNARKEVLYYTGAEKMEL